MTTNPYVGAPDARPTPPRYEDAPADVEAAGLAAGPPAPIEDDVVPTCARSTYGCPVDHVDPKSPCETL